MAIPSIAGWQIEALRLTFFANAPVSAAGKNWWSIATGHQPETMTTKPNTHEHVESGGYDNAQLELRVSFNRVDWILTPVPDPGAPTLGAAEEKIGALLTPIKNWLKSLDQDFIRLATGASFILPTDTLKDAGEHILTYLPFINLDKEKADDLFFQINLQCPSTSVKELTLNRIARFQSATAQYFTLSPTTSSQPLPYFEQKFFFKIEFDMNTDAHRTDVIPNNKAIDIFTELNQHCTNILGNGLTV